ncbi:hypothetical protein C0Q70_05289 [Pomacea canaliculata]|uniref:Uncharacterized protein n=1 Tax=Pomacea canaliculata TaxID=400727 RepID=A0A2T7PKW6_POMCA|nr:hypothetical protein C0Q70_05289 [Pomacea canaliculata]
MTDLAIAYRLATCRRKTLKYINSRTVLIAICALVVIECACVLAELMNEEQEILRFVQYLREKYPDQFASFDGRNVEDIFSQIQEAIVLKSPDDFSCLRCACTCPTASQTALQTESSSLTQSGSGDPARSRTLQQSVTSRDAQISAASPLREVADLGEAPPGGAGRRGRRSEQGSGDTQTALPPSVQFINNVKESFFLVAEYAPEHIAQNDTRHSHYHNEYDKIHKASTTLHIASLVILSVMVIEVSSDRGMRA